MDTCRIMMPDDVGKACTAATNCQSGFCVILGTDGGGETPPSPTVCSAPCTTSAQCTPGWTCEQQGALAGDGVCTCTPQPEACNGQDDNCDGKIDEEPGADEACTAQDMVPEKCFNGSCVCVTTCNGTCVDLTSDSSNCGKCNNPCESPLACMNSKCECAATMCGSKCIDTTSDNKNCGGCGTVCDYQCANSQCGPVQIATAMAGGPGIASDGKNVYFFSGTPSSFGGTTALQYCAVAGCNMTPTTLSMSVLPAFATNNSDPFAGGSLNILALSASSLYWVDGANVASSALSAPAARPPFDMGNAAAQPWQPATDSTYVYWADAGNLYIYRCALGTTCTNPTVLVNLSGIPLPIDAGAPEGGVHEGGIAEAGLPETGIPDVFSLDSGPPLTQAPQLIAVDNKYVYWTDAEGDVNAQLLAGGQPFNIYNASESMFGGFPPTSLVAVNGIVYFPLEGSGIVACSAAAPAACSAFAPPIFSPDTAVNVITTNGTDLYWSDANGATSINKCKLGATCANPTIVVDITTPQAEPGFLAVDATHVYWLDALSGGVFEFSN